MNRPRSIGVRTSSNPAQRLRPPIKCIDCQRDNPGFFWVKEMVWRLAGFRDYKDGIICLSCFAKRLGRPLTPNDFDDSGPCSNDAVLYMYAAGQDHANAPNHHWSKYPNPHHQES